MTTETLLKLQYLLGYKSKSLARDDARRIISDLTGSEKREAETWYAQNLGWSGTQELQSKYGI